ncbi:hypothetical protein PIB30_058594, partial [Stylosanthes scabra]|nr:hypothetical protein [Stylosanthes scabra]
LCGPIDLGTHQQTSISTMYSSHNNNINFFIMKSITIFIPTTRTRTRTTTTCKMSLPLQRLKSINLYCYYPHHHTSQEPQNGNFTRTHSDTKLASGEVPVKLPRKMKKLNAIDDFLPQLRRSSLHSCILCRIQEAFAAPKDDRQGTEVGAAHRRRACRD